MYIITEWALLKVGSSQSIPGVMVILLYNVGHDAGRSTVNNTGSIVEADNPISSIA